MASFARRFASLWRIPFSGGFAHRQCGKYLYATASKRLNQPRFMSGTSAFIGSLDRSIFDEKGLLYGGYDSTNSSISGFNHDLSSGMVIVRWTDGDHQCFPVVWLRDNCHCPLCYDSATHTRISYIQDLSLDIQIDAISISDDGQKLHIRWSDHHETSLLSDWLRCNRFDQNAKDPVLDSEIELWGADVMSSGRLRNFKFDDLLKSDTALHDWLMELMVLGISLVKDTPNETRQIHKIGDRIGYMMPTTFGEYIDVVAVRNSDNIAYKSDFLQPHTDYSYYMSGPAVGFFHCLVQAQGEGADSQLIDGFRAAKELRETDPEAFRILTKREIEYFVMAENKAVAPKGNYHLSRHPIIRLDSNQNLQKVVMGEYHMLKNFRFPVEEVPAFYRALKKFGQLLFKEESVFNYKLQPGDILTFSNTRMLHGRKAYELPSGEDNSEKVRHLQTCYFDLDNITSRLRILKNKRRAATGQ